LPERKDFEEGECGKKKKMKRKAPWQKNNLREKKQRIERSKIGGPPKTLHARKWGGKKKPQIPGKDKASQKKDHAASDESKSFSVRCKENCKRDF